MELGKWKGILSFEQIETNQKQVKKEGAWKENIEGKVRKRNAISPFSG